MDRHGLGLLNIDEPELDWHDASLADTRPRRTPSTRNGVMALHTPSQSSIGSTYSSVGSTRAPSWMNEAWIPSPNPDNGTSYPPPRSRGSKEQRPSTARSGRSIAAPSTSQYSLYPAPTKPLPPIPPPKNNSQRLSSTDSNRTSSISTNRSSQSNTQAAYGESVLPSPIIAPSSAFRTSKNVQEYQHSRERIDAPVQRSFSQRSVPKALSLHFWKELGSEDKKINNTVHYLDVAPTATILASKHGNNLIKVWSLASGELQNSIKFSSYTEAGSRSRDYLIRSHAILSESSTLIAVATRFGRSIEIFNWTKNKSRQTIRDVDRWTAGRFDMFDGERCPLAVYKADAAEIDVYLASQEAKKPLHKQRTIQLSKAGLPFVPILPELAISATSPLVVAAAGPRPPLAGRPPPTRETLLVAWETSNSDPDSNKPYRVARPWQHKELDTAIPCDLVSYGSVVVSIWIPASFRAIPVPATRKGSGYNLVPVKVSHRYVLVWDLSANSTRTIEIPNCISCISPDCRLVAYCDASGSGIGARGSLIILDVITGEEIWCWPDKNSIAINNDVQSGFRQFNDLGGVTELSFSMDGRFLVVGDSHGRMGVYDVRG